MTLPNPRTTVPEKVGRAVTFALELPLMVAFDMIDRPKATLRLAKAHPHWNAMSRGERMKALMVLFTDWPGPQYVSGWTSPKGQRTS